MNNARDFSTISKALQPGERVVWQGTPSAWIAARQFVYPLLFITFWMGFVLFGLWNVALKPQVEPEFSGLPIVMLCLFVAVGSYSWLQALRALMACWSTAYALTDRRIIISAGESNIVSFSAAALGDITRSGTEACGSLTFGSAQNNYSRRSWNFRASNGLYGIAEPARVEALIYQTLIMPKREGVQR